MRRVKECHPTTIAVITGESMEKRFIVVPIRMLSSTLHRNQHTGHLLVRKSSSHIVMSGLGIKPLKW